jgi:hypothetical protein
MITSAFYGNMEFPRQLFDYPILCKPVHFMFANCILYNTPIVQAESKAKFRDQNFWNKGGSPNIRRHLSFSSLFCLFLRLLFSTCAVRDFTAIPSRPRALLTA